MYMYVHILIRLYIYSISSIPLENLDFRLSRGIKKGSEVSEVFLLSKLHPHDVFLHQGHISSNSSQNATN